MKKACIASTKKDNAKTKNPLWGRAPIQMGEIPKNTMKASIAILAILVASCAAFADDVPVRWLEGAQGYKQALAIQQETKLPILVWTIWNECPYCANVTAYLKETKPREALRGYIRVMIDEHGQSADASFAKEHKFSGGYFYFIAPDATPSKESLWAWKPDGGRTIIPGLESVLAGKLNVYIKPGSIKPGSTNPSTSADDDFSKFFHKPATGPAP